MSIKEMFESSKQRILTGLVLLGIGIFVAFIDSFFITWSLLGVVYIISFHEVMKLFNQSDSKLYIYALLIWLVSAFYPNPTDVAFIALVLIVSVMAYKKEVNYKVLVPFLYPTISMLFLLTLYINFGMSALIWLVFVVGFTDTAAYFIGKSIGKTPFSKTSPNKTIEGVIGGVLVATVIGTMIALLSYSFLVAFFVSALISISSICGDLFESYLKREAGVKDSGTIFPGHGGFLDRVDGYLFGVIMMVFALRWIA